MTGSLIPNALKLRPVDRLRKAVKAQYPIVYLCTWEEDRVERMVAALAYNSQPQLPVGVWTISQGLVIGQEPIPDTADLFPAEGLSP